MDAGNECGVTVEDFSDWRQGDRLQVSICSSNNFDREQTLLETKYRSGTLSPGLTVLRLGVQALGCVYVAGVWHMMKGMGYTAL